MLRILELLLLKRIFRLISPLISCFPNDPGSVLTSSCYIICIFGATHLSPDFQTTMSLSVLQLFVRIRELYSHFNNREDASICCTSGREVAGDISKDKTGGWRVCNCFGSHKRIGPTEL